MYKTKYDLKKVNLFILVILVITLFSYLIYSNIKDYNINTYIYNDFSYDYSSNYDEVKNDKLLFKEINKYNELVSCYHTLRLSDSYFENEIFNGLLSFSLTCKDSSHKIYLDGYVSIDNEPLLLNFNNDLKLHYFYNHNLQLLNKSFMKDYSRKELDQILENPTFKEFAKEVNKKLENLNNQLKKEKSKEKSWR